MWNLVQSLKSLATVVLIPLVVFVLYINVIGSNGAAPIAETAETTAAVEVQGEEVSFFDTSMLSNFGGLSMFGGLGSLLGTFVNIGTGGSRLATNPVVNAITPTPSVGMDEFIVTAEMLCAMLLNIFLVLIIPALFKPSDRAAKKKQFYTGLFLNLAAALAVPIVLKFKFGLDLATMGILIGIFFVWHLVAFVASAPLVSPAYSNAFWFVVRKK